MELDEFIELVKEQQGIDLSGVLTTADKIDRPERALERQAIIDFENRNPMAGGGRINFYKGMSANRAPKKIKLKEPVTLTGMAGDKKLSAKQIDALDPNYLGDFTGGDLERPKKVYKSGTTGSVIDDAIEIRNIIVNNKGNIFNLEELGEKAGIFTKGTGTRQSGKGNRPDNRTVKAALEIAKDNFPEIANFKFVTDRYKIDGKQRQQLNMVVDTIKAYQNSTGNDKLANFLPENMGTFYKRVIEKGPKKLPANPEQGLYIKMYNFGPEQIRYISDRITDETGQTFTSKNYKNLITDVKKYRASVASDKAQFTRAIEMNADIKKLYDDKVIQNLIRGDLDNKAKKQILNRAVNLLGDDLSVASKRLFQMAQSIAGTRAIDGIAVEKDLGKKIIDTQRLVGKAGNGYAFSGLVYDHYGKVIDQALNSPKGKSFIGYYQKEIRNALDKGLVPDEIFSVTASARRGLEPYAIFTQALNADVNSRIKGASLDSLLSTTHRNLQNIFQGKTYDKLNTAEKKAVQDLVTTYENAKKDVVKDLKPNIRKTIQLPEFDLKNPPSKSIANYASFDQNLKSAFDRSYENVGYSMKVSKDMLTQKQLLAKIGCPGKGKKVPAASGGRIQFQDGLSPEICMKRGADVIKEKRIDSPAQKANFNKMMKIASVGKNMALLKDVLGPYGLGGDVLLEGMIAVNKTLTGGTPFKEAWQDSWLSNIVGGAYDEAGQKLGRQKLFELRSNLSSGAQEFGDYNRKVEEYYKLIEQRNNLEAMSGGGAFDYVGNLSGDVRQINNKIKVAERELGRMETRINAQGGFDAIENEYNRKTAERTDADAATSLQSIGRRFVEDNQLNEMLRDDFSGLSSDALPPQRPDRTPLTSYRDFKPDVPTLPELKTAYQEVGIPLPSDSVMKQDINQERFRQLFKQPGFMGASDTFFGDSINMAGSGIAKLAGVSSGPPPESGPNSQGLQGLFNRVKKV